MHKLGVMKILIYISPLWQEYNYINKDLALITMYSFPLSYQKFDNDWIIDSDQIIISFYGIFGTWKV